MNGTKAIEKTIKLYGRFNNYTFNDKFFFDLYEAAEVAMLQTIFGQPNIIYLDGMALLDYENGNPTYLGKAA